MPRRSVKRLQKGLKGAQALHRQWISTWRDAYRYVLPMRDVIDQPRPGQVKGNLVFDSTAIAAANQAFVPRLIGDLFPPFQDFVQLDVGPLVPDAAKDEARKQLKQISKVYHASVWRSNFQVAINEFALELAIGTGAMMMQATPDEDPEDVVFHPVSMPHLALEAGPFEKIGGVYRKHKHPVGVLEQQWKTLRFVMPDDWTAKIKEDPSQDVEYFEVTYFEPDDNAWFTELFRDDTDEFLIEEPIETKGQGPWIVTRWTKAPGEIYGRGPILYALADIRTLNKVKEWILRNAALNVVGLWTGVDDGVLNPNTVKILPGIVIPVARNSGSSAGASLAPLERTGQFDVGQLVIEDLRMDIKRMLFDKELPPETGQPRTATEIIARIKDLQVDTGPAFGRLMVEWITPMVLGHLQILHDKGKINFPFTIDGTTISVAINSPLARQQKLNDLEAMANAMQLGGALLGPETMAAAIKVEKIPAFIWDKLGVDPELLRDDAEKAVVSALIQQIAQQFAEEQQSGPASPPGVAGQGGGTAPALPPDAPAGPQAVAA